MNLPDFIDKNWLEYTKISIHDAAFWMEIGSDPKLHADQCKDGLNYSLYYLDHPKGEEAVFKKCDVIKSAITTCEISVVNQEFKNNSLDVYKTYILMADWIKFCKKNGYDELCNLFTHPTKSESTTTISYGSLSECEMEALFDPVTVAALEKMFDAGGKWKKWAERASRNGLIFARKERARFNPYLAANWFLKQKIDQFDAARCNRILGNNLPLRSKDYLHLFKDHIS